MTPNEQPTDTQATTPRTWYEEQPAVQPQYFAQPQPAPVQNVEVTHSLKGVRGWLTVWIIVFALLGLSYISIFVGALDPAVGRSVARGVPGLVDMVIPPVLAVASIATVVLIALEKRLAKYVALITIGTMALYAIASAILQESRTETVISLSGSITIASVIYGLGALYFVVSKRVKETLVK